jgi:transposase InsO family protein
MERGLVFHRAPTSSRNSAYRKGKVFEPFTLPLQIGLECFENGIEAIYQKPNTSRRHSEHKVYRYLLRGMAIERPNQVWCADITYIPMAKGPRSLRVMN